MTIEQAYQTLYGAALILFLVMIGAMCIRSIIGPRSTDRIMSVNMLGTMTICSIAILSVILDEGYLADVALIYAMISFVAVLMMASMFVPAKPKAPKLDGGANVPPKPKAPKLDSGTTEQEKSDNVSNVPAKPDETSKQSQKPEKTTEITKGEQK